MARKPSARAAPKAPFSSVQASKPAAPAKRVKKKTQDPANAYTYLPSLPKRSRTNAQTLSLSRDEMGEEPRRRAGDEEDEEEDDMAERIRKAGMMIAGEDKMEVESDESDVDSDMAWGSDGSDEERWGDVFARLNKGKGKAKAKEVAKPKVKAEKPLNVNLDESDDEDEDAQDESDPEAERNPVQAFKSAFPDEDDGEDMASDGDDQEDDEDEDEDDEDDEDDEEEDEDEDEDIPMSDDDMDESALDNLDAFVSNLAQKDSKKRKAGDTDAEPNIKAAASGEAKKRRVLPAVSGPGVRDVGGEFGLPSSNKLSLQSLLSSHPSLSSAAPLLATKTAKPSQSILKQGTLPAPLPTVVQDRLDREAAYEKTREEATKWQGVMKRVKEAEHLSFPLQPKARGGVKSGGEIVSGFKPSNEMESAVTALLTAANLKDSTLNQQEDAALQAQDLSVEEIAARRAELRHQRELVFRAETRAKRVAKIKSKTFRKLARKRDAKAELGLEDLDRLDPERADEEREKMERERAKERATLRHGARSGRWARGVGEEGGDEGRREKEEMLELKERLQRKIQGVDGSEDESSDEDEEEDEEEVKRRAFEQLAELENGAQPEVSKGKGLMAMKFMQNAEKRQMMAVRDEEDQLRRDIEDEKRDAEDSDSDEEKAIMETVGGNKGRLVFSAVPSKTMDNAGPSRPQPQAVSPTLGSNHSLASSHTLRSDTLSASTENPWLVASASSAGPSRKQNVAVQSKDAKAADKTARAVKKRTRAGEDEGRDDEVDIEVDGKALLGSTVTRNADDDESEDEMVGAFAQRDLVAQAFAGDNVVEDFAAEKQRQIEADAPKVEDTSLPGWGSWSGKGLKQRKPNQRFLKKTAGIDMTQRKDFKRNNVIITEKIDKKAAQFLPADLPYPYTSKAQYEASFKMPVGAEWNSRTTHQKETMPRVVKKPGAIIEPIERLF